MSHKYSELFRSLLENQSSLNTTAYSDTWLEKGKTGEWNYLLAANLEIAEFLNSYWLPWWSKAERDLVNCRIEIIDALHFILSDIIIMFDGNISAAVEHMTTSYDVFEESIGEANKEMDADIEAGFFIEKPIVAACALQAATIVRQETAMVTLFVLASTIDFDIEQMSALYFGKSALNKFRQDNGYKTGEYKKKWDGKKEDNYFLSAWVSEQISVPTVEDIRHFLETEYSKFK